MPIHGGLTKYVHTTCFHQLIDWQTQLITLYLFVCEHFNQGLWIHAQRFAPHADLGFTDEEVVTLYLAGILDLCTGQKCQLNEFIAKLRSTSSQRGVRIGFFGDPIPVV